MSSNSDYGKYYADVDGGNGKYFDTQKEAIKYAKKWAKALNKVIYVYKYQDPDSIRIGMDFSDTCIAVNKRGACGSLFGGY